MGRKLSSGAEGSNPACSSGESVANSIWAKAASPMRLPPRLLGALLAGGHVRSPLEDRLEQATRRRRNRAESGPQLVATSGRNRAEGRASASAVAGNGMRSEPVLR